MKIKKEVLYIIDGEAKNSTIPKYWTELLSYIMTDKIGEDFNCDIVLRADELVDTAKRMYDDRDYDGDDYAGNEEFGNEIRHLIAELKKYRKDYISVSHPWLNPEVLGG